MRDEKTLQNGAIWPTGNENRLGQLLQTWNRDKLCACPLQMENMMSLVYFGCQLLAQLDRLKVLFLTELGADVPVWSAQCPQWLAKICHCEVNPGSTGCRANTIIFNFLNTYLCFILICSEQTDKTVRSIICVIAVFFQILKQHN